MAPDIFFCPILRYEPLVPFQQSLAHDQDIFCEFSRPQPFALRNRFPPCN